MAKDWNEMINYIITYGMGFIKSYLEKHPSLLDWKPQTTLEDQIKNLYKS